MTFEGGGSTGVLLAGAAVPLGKLVQGRLRFFRKRAILTASTNKEHPMGLDMYLYARQFGTTKHGTARERDLASAIIYEMNAADFVDTDNMVFTYGEVCIVQWRKANAIHKFFVNLAGGKDECQRIYVEREDLQELLNRCDEILKEKSVDKAQELLPTQGGFFFGSTDYDEWYFEDLKYTQTKLTEILEKAPESWSFIYQASW